MNSLSTTFSLSLSQWRIQRRQDGLMKYQSTIDTVFKFDFLRYENNNRTNNGFVCLFVWLFVCGFMSHSRTFHSNREVTITGEGLQIFIYTRYLRPLSSEGYLACRTYCDTQVIRVWWSSPRTRDIRTCCRALGRGTITACFNDLDLSRQVIKSRSPDCKGNVLKPSHRYLDGKRFCR